MEPINLKNIIKDLNPWQILDYFDGPKLYSCKDSVGTIYLVYWLEAVDGVDIWAYLRVSPVRYDCLIRAQISLYTVLSNPEDGYLFKVKNVGDIVDVLAIATIDISLEMLPDPTDYLNIQSTHTSLISASSILPAKTYTALETATASKRYVLDIALVKSVNQYEIGCGKLGRILDAVQNSVYALAMIATKDANLKKVPEEVKFNNELLYTGSFQSSVGIRLQSKSSSLFNNDRDDRGTRVLASLLEATNTPESISEYVKTLNILARSRFKHLLSVLVDSEVSLKTSWGSPFGDEIDSKIDIKNLKSSLQYLEESSQITTQKTTYFGKLVGVDIESDFFAISLSDKQLIKGKLSRSLATRHFTVPSDISVIVEEVCKIDPLTDKEKWSYTLIDVIDNNPISD